MRPFASYLRAETLKVLASRPKSQIAVHSAFHILRLETNPSDGLEPMEIPMRNLWTKKAPFWLVDFKGEPFHVKGEGWEDPHIPFI